MFIRLLRRFPLLMRFALLALLVAAAGLWAYDRTLGTTLPPARMTLFPPGSLSPVFIERDQNGVPHIRARTDEDAWFGVGVAQAQDRLWQLELQRRKVRGELSELLGADHLRQDIWFRSMGLTESAHAAWEAMDPAIQRGLQRFVDGLNAGIVATSDLPLEFRLLGARPYPWTVVDVLAGFKAFALDANGSFQMDLVREAARRELSAGQLQILFPDMAPSTNPGVPKPLDEERGKAWALSKQALPPWPAAQLEGGNAWAVSSRHAAGAGALLAMDSHHALQIPSPWYAMEVRGASLAVSGVGLVGAPLVIFGRNQRIAWGGTPMAVDTQDVFFERTDSRGGDTYEASGRWHKFETRDALISVRVDRPDALFTSEQRKVQVRLRSTRNGPLISDQLRAFDHPFSLRWVGFAAGDTSYEAFHRLQFARDWPEFRAALRQHVAPALNMVYADVDGHIGSLYAGRIPVRSTGQGALPAPGWDENADWKGWVPSDSLPATFDPPSGYVVASGRAAADEGASGRIVELLEERIGAGLKLSLGDTQRIQGDRIDRDAAVLAAELRKKTSAAGDAAKTALRALDGWNGAMTAESQPALIFAVWTHHLRRALLDRGSSVSPQDGLLQGLDLLASNRGLLRWLSNCSAETLPDGAQDKCAALLAATLDASLKEAGRLAGSRNPQDWQLSAMQRASYSPTPVGRWSLLDALRDRETHPAGSPAAINGATASFVEKKGFVHRTGPSLRQVMQLGRDGVVHEFVTAPGQSGHPASPHYADMVGPMERLEYLQISDDQAAAAAEVRGRR